MVADSRIHVGMIYSLSRMCVIPPVNKFTRVHGRIATISGVRPVSMQSKKSTRLDLCKTLCLRIVFYSAAILDKVKIIVSIILLSCSV